MTKDEALKLALEALINELACDRTNDAEDDAAAEQMYDAIAAIKEALAIDIAADNEGFYGLPQGSVSTSNAGGKCVTDGETSP